MMGIVGRHLRLSFVDFGAVRTSCHVRCGHPRVFICVIVDHLRWAAPLSERWKLGRDRWESHTTRTLISAVHAIFFVGGHHVLQLHLHNGVGADIFVGLLRGARLWWHLSNTCRLMAQLSRHHLMGLSPCHHDGCFWAREPPWLDRTTSHRRPRWGLLCCAHEPAVNDGNLQTGPATSETEHPQDNAKQVHGQVLSIHAVLLSERT